MNTIWKYPLHTNVNDISVPSGAKLLVLDVQREVPTLWFLVDDKAQKEPRRFTIYGTGHMLPDSPGEYVGTFQLHDGTLVFHVFEVRP